MRRLFGLALWLTAILVLPAGARSQVVSPLQTGHYTPGTMGVRDMAHPAPGLFVLWYNLYSTSDTFRDIDGNEITNVNQIFPSINADIAYDVKAFATIPMVFWASDPIPFLGNANYLGGLSLNYVSADAAVFTERQGAIIDTTFRRRAEGNISGFSDMFFLPLGLSWGLEKADVTVTYGFAAPTGKYELGGSDNVGLGFWTHQFQGFGYFYPVADRSSAIMLGLTYELNSTIRDSDVKPGPRFSLEYGFSQYLTERFELSAQGGHNWQVGDDTGSDVYWNAGKHDRKSTAAFTANYWPWKDRLAVAVKYGFDYGARGRGLTNYWMLNLVFVPGVLDGS